MLSLFAHVPSSQKTHTAREVPSHLLPLKSWFLALSLLPWFFFRFPSPSCQIFPYVIYFFLLLSCCGPPQFNPSFFLPPRPHFLEPIWVQFQVRSAKHLEAPICGFAPLSPPMSSKCFSSPLSFFRFFRADFEVRRRYGLLVPSFPLLRSHKGGAPRVITMFENPSPTRPSIFVVNFPVLVLLHVTHDIR